MNLLIPKNCSNATATIYKSNEANDTSAPYVVSFSSRGPNAFTPDVLKVIHIVFFKKMSHATNYVH